MDDGWRPTYLIAACEDYMESSEQCLLSSRLVTNVSFPSLAVGKMEVPVARILT